ncbi:prepilin peptidase [Stenotrophomonas sp. PS02298]|uniref:A24 family peptidase n=1 Tax=Stenotrophomonas sp. PS02298 TaxID=2991424 RepID=UPI00249CDDA6|nr:prepilin peptidase [Stenotrophomonas sp. PS02298]
MTIAYLTALLLGAQVAISDLMARRVSNRALLAVLVCVVAMQLLQIGNPPSLASCLLGGVIGLAALLPFYAIGWMGAGDVKLFSVIGFLLGGSALLPIWIIASLAAGVHALVAISWPSAACCAPPRLQRMVQSLQGSSLVLDWQMDLRSARRGRRGIPYAAYLGLAMILVVANGGSHV